LHRNEIHQRADKLLPWDGTEVPVENIWFGNQLKEHVYINNQKQFFKKHT
jgi:hypothetical protein